MFLQTLFLPVVYFKCETVIQSLYESSGFKQFVVFNMLIVLFNRFQLSF